MFDLAPTHTPLNVRKRVYRTRGHLPTLGGAEYALDDVVWIRWWSKMSENMLNWCMHMKMSVVNGFVLHTAPVRLLSPFF